MTYPAIVAYVVAILAANLSIAHFGPASAPINAFLFIGFDLVLRDVLHAKLDRAAMLAVIAVAGALTYLLNPAAGLIATASATAFVLAAAADWAVFGALQRRSWLVRSNASNAAGALVDSIVFLGLIGVLSPSLVAVQFFAKVAGGAAWAGAFSLLRRRMA